MEATIKEHVPKLAKLEAKLNVYRRIAAAYVHGRSYLCDADELDLLKSDGFEWPEQKQEAKKEPDRPGKGKVAGWPFHGSGI